VEEATVHRIVYTGPSQTPKHSVSY
jgi:hypothetical protein